MFDIFANWPQTQILYPLTLVIHTVEHYNVLTLQHFISNLGGGGTKTATFVLSKLGEQSSSESASEWCLYLKPFKPNKKKKVEKLCTITTP